MKYRENNKTKKWILPAAVAALVSASLSACGGVAYREAGNAGFIPGGVVTIPGVTGGTGTGGVTGSTGTTGLLPAYQQTFQVTGQSGAIPSFSTTVTTDNVLAVKVTALSAGSNVVPGINTNASAPYACIQYTVSALGQTVQTNVLGVNGGGYLCPGASDNQVIDFSSRLTPGHGPVTITVKAQAYDFYCMQCLSNPYGPYTGFGMYSCNLFCPMHTVYQNHSVNGNLAIQVNGTTL